MNRNDTVADIEHCLGCELCADICPVQAIHYTKGSRGQTVPVVDQEICISCRQCKVNCPAQNIRTEKSVEQVLACRSKQHANEGSSGGMFYELALSSLEKGYCVVGAAFDGHLQLRHDVVTSIDEIPKLCKSKYVQSSCAGVYKELGRRLKNGENILFVGCPCQVSAVKNLYGLKFRSQLLLVDFLCHGTPEQKLFDLCLRAEEKKNGGRIESFKFRAKTRKAEHSFLYTYRTEKGKLRKRTGFAFEFPYYNAFLQYVTLRDGCYHCPYAVQERVGDITLGDFWGIDQYSKTFHAESGCSMVALNTAIGERAFGEIEHKFQIEYHPLHEAVDNNASFSSPTQEDTVRRAKIEQAFRQMSADEAIELCFSNKTMLKSKCYARCPKSILRIYTRIKKALK